MAGEVNDLTAKMIDAIAAGKTVPCFECGEPMLLDCTEKGVPIDVKCPHGHKPITHVTGGDFIGYYDDGKPHVDIYVSGTTDDFNPEQLELILGYLDVDIIREIRRDSEDILASIKTHFGDGIPHLLCSDLQSDLAQKITGKLSDLNISAYQEEE